MMRLVPALQVQIAEAIVDEMGAEAGWQLTGFPQDQDSYYGVLVDGCFVEVPKGIRMKVVRALRGT